MENEENNEDKVVSKKEKKAKKANKKNLNLDAAFLHILGDLLNSVGVIIAATIIYIWP